MAYQEIDTSNSNGKGAGDPAKTAFEKAKSMFKEIYDWMGAPSVSGNNSNFGGASSNTVANINIGKGSASSISYIDLFSAGSQSANANPSGRVQCNNGTGSMDGEWHFNGQWFEFTGDIMQTSGALRSYGGLRCRAGSGGGEQSHSFNTTWDSGLSLYVDATNIGSPVFSTSDRRLKKAIADLDIDALSIIDASTTRKWEYADVEVWKADGVTHWGWIADELQKQAPALVKGEKDAVTAAGGISPQSLDPIGIAAVLWKGTQELHALVKAQAATIDALTARVDALEAPATASGS